MYGLHILNGQIKLSQKDEKVLKISKFFNYVVKYSKVSIIRPGRSRLLEFEIEIVLVF